MDIKIQIPEIPEEKLTPTVRVLLAIISQCMQIIEAQRKEIQLLKDEIARLKGRSQRPKIKASKLNSEIIKIYQSMIQEHVIKGTMGIVRTLGITYFPISRVPTAKVG